MDASSQLKENWDGREQPPFVSPGGTNVPLLSPPGLLEAADRLEAGCGKCRQGLQGPQSQLAQGQKDFLAGRLTRLTWTRRILNSSFNSGSGLKPALSSTGHSVGLSRPCRVCALWFWLPHPKSGHPSGAALQGNHGGIDWPCSPLFWGGGSCLYEIISKSGSPQVLPALQATGALQKNC